MAQTFHCECLKKICRVCGCYLEHTRAKYSCEDHQDGLIKAFNIDHTSDLEDTHPPFFCERCLGVVVKAVAAAKDEKVYLHSVRVCVWSGHEEEDCQVCNQVAVSRKGGRPKKARKNRGRPRTNSVHTRLERMRNYRQESYLPCQVERSTLVYSVPSSLGVKQSDLECPVCMILLDRPVQLACGAVLCMECVCRYNNHDVHTL